MKAGFWSRDVGKGEVAVGEINNLTFRRSLRTSSTIFEVHARLVVAVEIGSAGLWPLFWQLSFRVNKQRRTSILVSNLLSTKSRVSEIYLRITTLPASVVSSLNSFVEYRIRASKRWRKCVDEDDNEVDKLTDSLCTPNTPQNYANLLARMRNWSLEPWHSTSGPGFMI